jgi:hypothetical protein
MAKYTVFVRNWWKDDPAKKGALIPNLHARRKVIGYADSIEQARRICASYNDHNKPGKYSRMAEFTSDY